MICTHQRVHNDMTLGELEFLNIYSRNSTLRFQSYRGPFLSTSRAVTRIGSSLDLFFHRKVYSEYIFCSFNRKILANLPTVQEGYDIGNDVHVFRISDDRRWYGCCNFALDLSGSPIHRVLQATMYQSVHLYSQRRRRVRIHVI
jgi:hypothetical protein